MGNLRSRLFLALGLLTVLLWAGVFWGVEGTVEASFNRSARHSFARTKLALDSLQQEQSRRMHQVGVLVMQIPELRALIAEYSYELQSGYSTSIEERLDHLADVVEVDFVCAIDGDATLIGRSRRAPWEDASEFGGFAAGSKAAQQMLRVVFGVAPPTDAQGERRPAAPAEPSRGTEGLWSFKGRLYQVVAVPLIFQQDASGNDGPIEGALMVGSPLTDQIAAALGRSQDCEVSFLIDDTVTASSLHWAQRQQLGEAIRSAPPAATATFVTKVDAEPYLTMHEPLIDPCSGARVGAIVIQRTLADSHQLLDALLKKMLVIIGCGLILAGLGSFVLSIAITRPIHQLLHAVRRVGAGDLSPVIPQTRRGEFGALATAFNEMVRQLRERQDLERQVVEVETATRTKTEFLASMSHEIRTPMTAILGWADRLRDPDQSPEERTECVDVIRRNGDHLLSIINDILDLSKIEAGEMRVEKIPCSPCVVMSDVCSMMRVRAMEKNLGLEAKIEGAIPRTIHGDPTRLRQILINLVGNAIKFTESGCVRVVAALTDGADGTPVQLQFQVIDSGIGMTEAEMQRIFEPFSQADASTTRRFGGTGLGLSICQRLTHMLGGRITVDSRPKLGSIFTVTVDTGPLDGVPMVDRFDESVDGGPSGRAAAAPLALRGRILLADDGADNRRLLSLYLRTAGAQVTEAENGSVACAKAMEADPPFDLILMDMQMPEMDGYAAVAHLRRLGYTGPVIALTANAMPDDEARCRQCGCDEYLTKPVAREHLILAIAAHVDGAGGADASARTGAPASGEPVDESVAAVLESYVDSLPAMVGELRALLAEQDLAELAVAAHRLRGSGGLFGFTAITERAAAAESAIAGAALPVVAQKVRDLVEEIRRVRGYEPDRESPAPRE